eukprot:TRINITY_DN1464_c0_g1_i1.p1 TRINITY_DN1464_c0_g1~~TRINITY_DN1464_c0_g1_i1.p1  ORF type:complete len:660 (-),score=93.17 TRINITY_DN1464_c0_g1_i1:665-2644(-)
MEKRDSILDIPVQNPPSEDFSSIDLSWTKVGTTEHHVDEVALILYNRVDAFIIGECSNMECPTRFHIEKGRKRPKGSLKNYKCDEYLEYRLYWCSFGPENYGEGGDILPSRRYRLNTRNRAARPQSMRGCTCHFVVKRLYARPSVALIIYNERRHVNKSGYICHGPLDRDAIGPGAKKISYICNEIQASIRLWVERHKKSVFFYQDSSDVDPFILGIQTEWQLQQMIRFGHHSLVAADSAFGIKKLKYPLYSLLVFDSRQHALPVAWVITRSFAKQDICKWMKALTERIRVADSTWRINGFVIDDAAAEVDPIRDIFCSPVLFGMWRVRRSWLRSIIKRCSNIEVQREIFKRLGQIMYGIWNGSDSVHAMGEFIQDFIDQTAFMQYFKECWVPKIEMWLATMKSLPLASQEASGAIEAYHVKLKLKLYDDSHLGALQRVDWLVHKLTTELHSSYWLDRHADESDSFQTVKEEYVSSTSWYRAMQIPDTAVILDDKGHPSAKVASQKDSSQTHLVWNPGSEFAFCDCSWSMQGNLCKHVIKVNMICQNRSGYQPSMSFQSFRKILLELWQKPIDDSIALDRSMALTDHMQGKIQRLVELDESNNIGSVVNNLRLKWVCKKGRTSFGKPAGSAVALPPSSKSDVHKKRQKRKRLSRLKGSA